MPAISSAQKNTMPMPIPAHPHHPMLWSYQNIIVIASNQTARKLFTHPLGLTCHKTGRQGPVRTSVRDLRPLYAAVAVVGGLETYFPEISDASPYP